MNNMSRTIATNLNLLSVLAASNADTYPNDSNNKQLEQDLWRMQECLTKIKECLSDIEFERNGG